MLYNLLVIRAKTIRLATSVGLGMAVFGGLACHSADKIEETEPASVPQVTAVEPIRFETVEPSETETRQIVIEDDVRKLCEVRDNWKPMLINGVGKPPPDMILWETIDDDLWRIRFDKRGALTPPDIIHDRMWEDERKNFLLAPPPGK